MFLKTSAFYFWKEVLLCFYLLLDRVWVFTDSGECDYCCYRFGGSWICLCVAKAMPSVIKASDHMVGLLSDILEQYERKY